jgi:hypothetical protein
MDVLKMLAELRDERIQIEQAIHEPDGVRSVDAPGLQGTDY